MSYFYEYDFVSPDPIYSNVKEELKSYFDTGAVDDLMFPVYLDKCLRKLGRTSYAIVPVILDICDFEARLPDNFYAVREAWLCTEIPLLPYQSANSFYSQTGSTTIQVGPYITDDPSCHNCSYMPELIQCVYKTNNEIARSLKREFLLKPGNISVKANCDLRCRNFGSNAPDSFDIRDNKFITNFRHGTVFMLMYAVEEDDMGNQLVPDNYRIAEFIEAFLKYKVFETISNQVTDETFNQTQQKMMYYKQLCDEAYILADIEIKKQTVYEKQRRIIQQKNRFNMYELPNRRRIDPRNHNGPYRNSD